MPPASPGFLVEDERTCLFIDGANLHATARGLGLSVDFRAMLAHVRASTRLVRAYYYSAVIDSEEYTPVRPLLDWLSYNGYAVVSKTAREFTDPHTGHRRTKGNMDIELAIDMLELAPSMEHAVLFSGDSDFRRLVEAVQRRGVRVSVVSSTRTQPPIAADELRRQADHFVELAEFGQHFARRSAGDNRGHENRNDGRGLPARYQPSRSAPEDDGRDEAQDDEFPVDGT